MTPNQDAMGGMFGPSPEDINRSLDSEFMANNKGADITDIIGQMGTRGFRRIAGAFGYEDERVAKARLVQEAVKEARDNSEPGDIKGMYKNLADSFAKRGLDGQAMQAIQQYRKLEMEDKTFGLESRKVAATESQASSTARQAGVAERGVAVAEAKDTREAEGHKFKMQLDQMTIKEKQIAVAKLEMEMADLQKKQAAIALIPDYHRTQAQQELDKRKAEIQHLIDTGKAALGQAGAAATNAATNARIADSTIELHKAQAAKVNEEKARLERDFYTHSMKTEVDGTVVIMAVEAKPKSGQKPKRELIRISPEGVRTVTDLDAAAPQSAAPSVSPTLDAAKAELARRQAAKEGK